MDSTVTLNGMISSLRATLEQMARWGCSGFDCSRETLDILERWEQIPSAEKTVADPPKNNDVDAVRKQEKDAGLETLEQIRSDLGDCRRCKLAARRTHIVFGEGHPKARLVFVGEGPGSEEDRSGLPFVGPAGQLLTKIIQAMKLTRDQVYICNVIKCRPPDNRDPSTEEIATCRSFMARQLAAIAPEVICTLGTHATQTLMNTASSISNLRGRFHNYNKTKLMPTYHPAYLLRHPERKRDVWEDMKKIMALLRIPQ